MRKNKKVKTALISFSIAAATTVTAVLAAVYNVPKLNGNPWDHTLLVSGDNGCINTEGGSISVNGDALSNGNITFNGEVINVSGYAAASGSIVSSANASYGSVYEGIEAIDVPDVWSNVYSAALSRENEKSEFENVTDNYLTLNGAVISGNSLIIDISVENAPVSETANDETAKIGAFGAGFFTKAYENKEKWEKIFPILFEDPELETNSVIELGNNSNFIPVQEQSVSGSWEDYDLLPGSVISDNFSEDRLKEYIAELKQDNPVFTVCSSDYATVHADASVNPEEAANAEKIVVEGGNLTLSGDYEDLEEIKLDNWGGVQLIGNFPNLKYIYRTGNSDLNLAGEFPALECVYMTGGQLLLGSGDNGFCADGLTVIDEYGPIIVYTAKDVSITNSRLATSQMILMRGAGADQSISKFNAENTLMAAVNGIMFEDMNDGNTARFENLPVYYSVYPMSIINCNFKLLQGTFINNSGAIIMANANIDIFRGFMFSPEGIDEYRNSSAVGFYVNTYAYNVSPNINNLNKQPDGTEEIGRISDFEYSDFPEELASLIGDAERFLSDLQNESDGFTLGEADGIPGELLIGSYVLAEGDIVISADTMKNKDDSLSVIASEKGDITLNIKESADVQAIIYAPNGKVTINAGSGDIYGRVFAQEINIDSSYFVITGGTEDISYLGFVYNEDADSSSEDSEVTDSGSSDDSHRTDSSSSDDSETSEDSKDSSDNSDQGDDSSLSGDSSEEAASSKETESSDSSDGSRSDNSDSQYGGSSSNDSSSSDSKMSEGFNEPEYEYDKLDRLIKVIYDENNYIEYEYDLNGNITKIITVIDGVEK